MRRKAARYGVFKERHNLISVNAELNLFKSNIKQLNYKSIDEIEGPFKIGFITFG